MKSTRSRLNHSINGEYDLKAREDTKSKSMKLLLTLLKKDVKLEIRNINDFLSIILFDIIAIFIFSSVYNVSTQQQKMAIEIFIIEIWLVIFFTLIFIMAKLLVKEKEIGTLNGLISSPLSANIIFLSKVLFGLILLSFIEIILIIFGLFISNPTGLVLNIPWWLFIITAIVLPTIDLCITGTLISAFSMYVKNKSFVLFILIFPIILPITSPIISLSVKLLQGLLFSDIFIEFCFIFFHILLMSAILIFISENLLYE